MTDKADGHPDPRVVDFRLVDNLVYESVALAMVTRLDAGVSPDAAISSVLDLAKRAWASARALADMQKTAEKNVGTRST